MDEVKLVFCKRCGSMALKAFAKSDHCPVCHHVWDIFEYDTVAWFNLPGDEKDKYIEEHIIHDGETEYFKQLKAVADAKNKKEWDDAEERVKKLTQPKPTNIPHCPICGSADLKKLSTVGKAAKIGIFGIFGMGDVGKTYKCNNCGSKF